MDAAALVAGSDWQGSLVTLGDQAIRGLRDGKSVMLHTARGPHDPRIEAMIVALAARGLTWEQAKHEGRHLLGQRSGQLVDRVLREVRDSEDFHRPDRSGDSHAMNEMQAATDLLKVCWPISRWHGTRHQCRLLWIAGLTGAKSYRQN